MASETYGGGDVVHGSGEVPEHVVVRNLTVHHPHVVGEVVRAHREGGGSVVGVVILALAKNGHLVHLGEDRDSGGESAREVVLEGAGADGFAEGVERVVVVVD